MVGAVAEVPVLRRRAHCDVMIVSVGYDLMLCTVPKQISELGLFTRLSQQLHYLVCCLESALQCLHSLTSLHLQDSGKTSYLEQSYRAQCILLEKVKKFGEAFVELFYILFWYFAFHVFRKLLYIAVPTTGTLSPLTTTTTGTQLAPQALGTIHADPATTVATPSPSNSNTPPSSTASSPDTTAAATNDTTTTTGRPTQLAPQASHPRISCNHDRSAHPQ